MKNTSSANFINEFPFYDVLSEDEKHDFKKFSHLVSYFQGEILFRQDSPVSHIMFLQTGLIKVFINGRHNSSLVFGLITPGNFVTLLNASDQDLYRCSAKVVEHSNVVLTEISFFRNLIKNNGEFASLILKYAGTEGLNIISRFMNQFQKQLPGRVADMLLYFSEKIYKSETFTLPLTRRELAELAGTTKESMIRTLAEFRHDKIIKLDGKKVEITSPAIIRTLSRLG